MILYEKNSRHNTQSITQQRTYVVVDLDLDFISRYVDGDNCYGFADDYGDDYNDSGVMFDISYLCSSVDCSHYNSSVDFSFYNSSVSFIT